MNTFCINVLTIIIVFSTCFGHPSVSSITHILSPAKLLVWMHEINDTKLHVLVFLRMNNWTFETCRRRYN